MHMGRGSNAYSRLTLRSRNVYLVVSYCCFINGVEKEGDPLL